MTSFNVCSNEKMGNGKCDWDVVFTNNLGITITIFVYQN